MPSIKEIASVFENFAPLSLQESYDNSGLQIGDPNKTVNGALLCLDIVEETIDEAISMGCNLIISHHPLIFSGLKSLTGKNYIERVVIKAIQNNIALYASHTNLDMANGGVNDKICQKLGLLDCKVLSPAKNSLLKLVTFVPTEYADKVREAIFEAGAGNIGNYDACSFSQDGTGSFRPGDNTNAFVGEKGELHNEPEIRIETIVPSSAKSKVISALQKSHPYEEVAYDLYPLDNANPYLGIGRIGRLPKALSVDAFIDKLKDTFKADMVRFTELNKDKIETVALCGGSGAFLIKDALRAGADAFVSGDMKYHEFFMPEKKMLLADVGHYESEQFTVELFNELLTKNFPTFAVHYSEVKSNPLKYR